ncbi:hypothetical protein CHLRE_12g500700v5 [Chlamydomonas reinhardtii]|uniref:RING-type domain-containing protein n=1 Tax=Chlamydomonas reinhardtii TaxID=3055 RepID=A0A2K3D383_CHLRE|nr:uncharacterized protein CHLRE_12g500700v5 [Chlamydomonas reinhardtii]PNW75002.1 hypothetical protein CHLRE_12g500700v5 [Chlamydomonas reinhardtii]
MDESTRDAKAVARAAKHQEDVEAAQVRERARLAALRLEGEAAAAAAAAAGRAHTSGAALASTSTGNGTSSGKTAAAPGGGGGVAPERERDELEAQFISSEVAEVRAKLPREGQRERLRSATEDCVQVVISASRVRSVLLKAFFPTGYPATPLALELEALAAPPPGSSGGSSSSSSGLGCSLELKTVKEKSGLVEVVLRAGGGGGGTGTGGGYFLDLRCVVPEAYPDAGVELHAAGSNLPADLLTSSLAGAADLVRRLAEPPPAVVRVDVARAGAGTGCSNPGSGSSSAASSASATPQRRRGAAAQQTAHSQAKAAALAAAAQEGAAAREAARAAAAAAHEPRPSLWAAVSYLGSRCVGLLCEGRCVACGKRLLPTDPAKQDQVPPGMHLLRLVTCGHFFHHKCIEGLLAEPPFGRDGCPVPGCGERISHHHLVTEPQVLEARWAGRQARRREIEDAASILGL